MRRLVRYRLPSSECGGCASSFKFARETLRHHPKELRASRFHGGLHRLYDDDDGGTERNRCEIMQKVEGETEKLGQTWPDRRGDSIRGRISRLARVRVRVPGWGLIQNKNNKQRNSALKAGPFLDVLQNMKILGFSSRFVHVYRRFSMDLRQ